MYLVKCVGNLPFIFWCVAVDDAGCAATRLVGCLELLRYRQRCCMQSYRCQCSRLLKAVAGTESVENFSSDQLPTDRRRNATRCRRSKVRGLRSVWKIPESLECPAKIAACQSLSWSGMHISVTVMCWLRVTVSLCKFVFSSGQTQVNFCLYFNQIQVERRM